jgi:ABC-type Fe3+ transport system permease subunit
MADAPKLKGYWGISILVAVVVFGLIAAASYFGNWHWASNLWFNYGWSSDKGNGPEAIQQTILYAVVAAVFIPVVRHFIAKEFAKVHQSIHIHGTEITAHLHHIAEKSGIERFEHSDAYKEQIAK